MLMVTWSVTEQTRGLEMDGFYSVRMWRPEVSHLSVCHLFLETRSRRFYLGLLDSELQASTFLSPHHSDYRLMSPCPAP